MLCMKLKKGETVYLPETSVSILSVESTAAKIGIVAPDDQPIVRGNVLKRGRHAGDSEFRILAEDFERLRQQQMELLQRFHHLHS